MKPPSFSRSFVLTVSLLLAPVVSLAEPIAVTHVHVVPMDVEAVLADRTVILDGGKITAIGPADELEPPAGALVVDGRGKYLLPGLHDMHVHLYEEDLEDHLTLYLANGVTTVQSMHGSPWHLKVRERLRKGELLGPRLFTTGPTTATGRVNSPEKAGTFVAEQKAAGYDAIKMYGDGSDTMTRETYARLISAAHAAGLRVVGHAPRNHPFSVVLEEGQDSIDHMEEIVYTYTPIVEVQGPLLDIQFRRVGPEASDEALAQLDSLAERMVPAAKTLAAEARKVGLVVTPTLVTFEAIHRQTTPAYPKLLEAPEMRYISPLRTVEWGPELNGYRSGWSDRLELMDKVLGKSLELQKVIVKALHDAGVPLLTGTDAPLDFVYPGFALHRELELFVESGLTPYEALRAATVQPARELGTDEEEGTVAVGRRADLVLLEANPLEDVTNASRIAGVFAAGRFLPRSELDERLAEIAARNAPLAAQMKRLMAFYREGSPEKIAGFYHEARQDGVGLAKLVERLVNSLGYERLNDDGDPDGAVEAFRINAKTFPDSGNVWDSLGEGLMAAGDDQGALESYRKSLAIDPGNENGRRRLEWLEEAIAARATPVEHSLEELERLAGDYGPRHVRLRDGALYYQRDNGVERRLVAMTKDTFTLVGLPSFRLRFDTAGDGPPPRVLGLYSDGRTDESVRDGVSPQEK